MPIKIEDAPPGSTVVMTNAIMLHLYRWKSDDVLVTIDSLGGSNEFDVKYVTKVFSVDLASLDIWRKLLTIIPDRHLASELLDITDLRGREFWRHYTGLPLDRAAMEAIFELSKDPLELMEDACASRSESSTTSTTPAGATRE